MKMIRLRPLIQLDEITNFLRQKKLWFYRISNTCQSLLSNLKQRPPPLPPSQNNDITRGYRTVYAWILLKLTAPRMKRSVWARLIVGVCVRGRKGRYFYHFSTKKISSLSPHTEDRYCTRTILLGVSKVAHMSNRPHKMWVLKKPQGVRWSTSPPAVFGFKLVETGGGGMA